MTLKSFLELIVQTLSGLAAVHDAGIVHRDIKPGNLFIVSDADGEYTKLLDFGVSRPKEDPRASFDGLASTEEGMLVGTLQYLSPELAKGENPDIRSDIYSVGLIIYEALSGRRPFNTTNIAVLLSDIASGNLPPLSQVRPDLPARLSDLVSRAMAIDPKDRYGNARELRAALGSIMEEGPETALKQPLPMPEKTEKDPDSLGVGEFIHSKRNRPTIDGATSRRRRDSKRAARFFLTVGIGSLLLAVGGLMADSLSSSAATTRTNAPMRGELDRSIQRDASVGERVTIGDAAPSNSLDEYDAAGSSDSRLGAVTSEPGGGGEMLERDSSSAGDIAERRGTEANQRGVSSAGKTRVKSTSVSNKNLPTPEKSRTGELIRDLGF